MFRRSSNHFLLNLKADLIKKYVNVRDQEAVFWHQNSRDIWLQDGDKIKTLIFHLITLVRRTNIEWLYDDAEI